MRQSRLWRCPKCGHRFVTRNLWHSCSRHTIAEHFRGTDPRVRQVWRAFVAIVRRFGPVTVYAQKTRIVCQHRIRFAGAQVRRSWLRPGLLLDRRAAHPTLARIEFIPPRYYAHYFRVNHSDQLDRAFVALVKEAWKMARRSRSEPVGNVNRRR